MSHWIPYFPLLPRDGPKRRNHVQKQGLRGSPSDPCDMSDDPHALKLFTDVSNIEGTNDFRHQNKGYLIGLSAIRTVIRS